MTAIFSLIGNFLLLLLLLLLLPLLLLLLLLLNGKQTRDLQPSFLKSV